MWVPFNFQWTMEQITLMNRKRRALAAGWYMICCCCFFRDEWKVSVWSRKKFTTSLWWYKGEERMRKMCACVTKTNFFVVVVFLLAININAYSNTAPYTAFYSSMLCLSVCFFIVIVPKSNSSMLYVILFRKCFRHKFFHFLFLSHLAINNLNRYKWLWWHR